jgi:hypothetical protein
MYYDVLQANCCAITPYVNNAAMAPPIHVKRTAAVPIRTLPSIKERLEKEAKRRNRTVTWITEQCWEAYLPIMEAEPISRPEFPTPPNMKKKQ